ncbi:MAG: hypothetical protein RIT81_23115 [Deltaproteobacteria bacterium]
MDWLTVGDDFTGEVPPGAWVRVDGDVDMSRLACAARVDLQEAEVTATGLRALLFAADQLTWLTIGDEDCRSEILDIVAEHASETLTSLTLHGYLAATLGDEDIARFVTSATFERLATLYLWNVNLGPRAARAIAAADNSLTELSFSGGNYTKNTLGPDGAAALDTTKLAALQSLALSYNGLGEAGVEALGKARHLRDLRTLVLTANDFTHDGFKHLAVSDVLDTIEALHVDLNGLDSRAMGALARVPAPALKTLDVSGNPIGDDGLRAIVRSPWAAQLRRLVVVGAKLTNAELLLELVGKNAAVTIAAHRNAFGTEGTAALRAAERIDL